MNRKMILLAAIAFLTGCGTASQGTSDVTEYADTPVSSEIINVEETGIEETTIVETTTAEPADNTTVQQTIGDTATDITTEEKKVPLEKTVTSDGIELDPDSEPLSPDEAINAWEHMGQGFLLKRFDDHNAVYGVFSNETKTIEYGDIYPVERVIIQHDGKVDDFECAWTGRWQQPASVIEAADIDHDGADEIIMINYVLGGTMCYVVELNVFDEKNGAYNRSSAWDAYEDVIDTLNNSFRSDIDADAKRVTYKTDAGTFWQDYSNITEDTYEGVKVDTVAALDLISFEINDDSITGTFTAGGGVEDMARLPFFFTDFEFDVKFDGEKISFENYRLSGYDCLLKQERSDEYGVGFTVIAHDRTTDEYIEVVSDSAFLPENADNSDRYSCLEANNTEILGQNAIEVKHSAMNLMIFDYYAIIDGKPVKLAENYGNNIYDEGSDVWKTPRTISYDLDDDGCPEFITEDMHGDGSRSVNIYRFENGKPYVSELSVLYGEPDNGLQGYPNIVVEKNKDGKYIEDASDYIIKIGSYTDKNGETQPEKELRLGDLKIEELGFKEYTAAE